MSIFSKIRKKPSKDITQKVDKGSKATQWNIENIGKFLVSIVVNIDKDILRLGKNQKQFIEFLFIFSIILFSILGYRNLHEKGGIFETKILLYISNFLLLFLGFFITIRLKNKVKFADKINIEHPNIEAIDPPLFELKKISSHQRQYLLENDTNFRNQEENRLIELKTCYDDLSNRCHKLIDLFDKFQSLPQINIDNNSDINQILNSKDNCNFLKSKCQEYIPSISLNYKDEYIKFKAFECDINNINPKNNYKQISEFYENIAKKYIYKYKKNRIIKNTKTTIYMLLISSFIICLPYSSYKYFDNYMLSNPDSMIVAFSDYSNDDRNRSITNNLYQGIQKSITKSTANILELRESFNDGESARKSAEERRATMAIWGTIFCNESKYNNCEKQIYRDDQKLKLNTHIELLTRADKGKDIIAKEAKKVGKLTEEWSTLGLHTPNVRYAELTELNDDIEIQKELNYITNFMSGLVLYTEADSHISRAISHLKDIKPQEAKLRIQEAISRFEESINRFDKAINYLNINKSNPIFDREISRSIIEKINKNRIGVITFYKGNSALFSGSITGNKKNIELAIENYNQAINILNQFKSGINIFNDKNIYSNKNYSTSIKNNHFMNVNHITSQSSDNGSKLICKNRELDSDISINMSSPDINILLARIYNNRGIAYLMKGDKKKALNDFLHASQYDPDMDEICVNIGYINHSLQRPESAIKSYGRALIINKKDEIALNNFGLSLFEKNKYSSSIKYFDKAINIDKNYRDAYFNRSRSYLFDDKYRWSEESNYDFEKVISLSPTNKKYYYYSRGLDYYNLHEYDQAIDLFNKAIDLDNSFLQPKYHLGEIYLSKDKKDSKKAIQYFLEINSSDRNINNSNIKLAEAYVLQGNERSDSRRYNDAIKSYKNAINYDKNLEKELIPKLSIAYYFKAKEYLNLNDKEEAISAFSEVIELKSLNLKESYYMLGIIHKKNKEYELSIDKFNSSINEDPNYIEAYFQRGLLFKLMTKNGLAIDDFKKVLEIQKNNTEANFQLGDIYLALGNSEAARKHIQLGCQHTIDQKHRDKCPFNNMSPSTDPSSDNEGLGHLPNVSPSPSNPSLPFYTPHPESKKPIDEKSSKPKPTRKLRPRIKPPLRYPRTRRKTKYCYGPICTPYF